MNFCENCSLLTEKRVCPQCGASVRAPKESDLILFAEFDGRSNGMFSDALSNNEIDFVSVPVYGGYSRLNTPASYNLYVKFADYDAAFEIYDVIFVNSEQQPSADDDPSSIIDSLVKVVVDRPYGSVHPEHPDIKYKLNYGCVQGVIGGDGEEQDAYIVGVNYPLERGAEFCGYVIAVIVRKNDVETKWVVAPVYGGISPRTPKYTKEQIAAAVNFQEKFFDIEVIM